MNRSLLSRRLFLKIHGEEKQKDGEENKGRKYVLHLGIGVLHCSLRSLEGKESVVHYMLT